MCDYAPIQPGVFRVNDPVLSSHFTDFWNGLKVLSGDIQGIEEKVFRSLNGIACDIVFRLPTPRSAQGPTQEDCAIWLHAITLFTVAAHKIQAVVAPTTARYQTNFSQRALTIAQQYLSTSPKAHLGLFYFVSRTLLLYASIFSSAAPAPFTTQTSGSSAI